MDYEGWESVLSSLLSPAESETVPITREVQHLNVAPIVDSLPRREAVKTSETNHAIP